VTGGSELEQFHVGPANISEADAAKARIAVAARAVDAADARELLSALGLISATQTRDICGTTAGRNRHHQLGESACKPCERAYWARRREAGESA
jgi:hypothetical protein